MGTESPATSYAGVLKRMKERIRERQQRASVAVNVQLLALYWEIGTVILAQQEKEGWGAKVIKRLASDLKAEFSNMTGFSERNLKYMRAFSEAYPHFPFVQTMSAQTKDRSQNEIVQTPSAQLDRLSESELVQAPLAQLSWSHHTALLDKIHDEKERHFYIQKAIENGWSRNVMLHQIESELYKRQGAAITNFKQTLPAMQSDLARETLKSPYVFDFLAMGEKMQERDLEQALTANIKNFLLELGKGFAYVGNQFNLNVAGDEFFLDLLFYNTRLHCYVVFELKVGEFKPEFAGKLNFYINTVDEQVKTERDEPTIGVLLCKTPNKTVVEYALRGVEKPLGIAEYELSKILPEQLKSDLPTVEELSEAGTSVFESLKTSVTDRLEKIKDSIRTSQNEEIQKTLQDVNYAEIICAAILPIIKQCEELLAEIKDQFAEWDLLLTSRESKSGYLVKPWGEEQIRRNIHTHKERYKDFKMVYRFRGYRHNGINHFDQNMELFIRILPFHYELQAGETGISKLYHQTLKKTEVTRLTDSLVNSVIDNIERKLNQKEY